MGEVAIRAVQLALARGGRPVLENVELEIPRGAVVAVVGPNGAGKSTLAAALAGRLRPMRGELEVGGASLRHGNVREARARIGFFGDEVTRLLAPDTTAREAVALGPHGGLRTAWFALEHEELEAADQLLAHVGLVGFERARLADLSAGQRQRVLLARAFAGAPVAIVLDEPTSHLDLVGREEAIAALEGLLTSPSAPLACVIVSHHLEELPRNVTHAIVVFDGQTRMGPRSVLLDQRLMERAFGRRISVEEVEGRLLARLAG